MNNNIAELRKAAGLTQTQLANRVGIDRSVLAKIEKGTYAHSVSITTADRLAHALGVTIYVVFSGLLSEVDYIQALSDEREDAYTHMSSAFMKTANALCDR